jgi:hypothetical protein
MARAEWDPAGCVVCGVMRVGGGGGPDGSVRGFGGIRGGGEVGLGALLDGGWIGESCVGGLCGAMDGLVGREVGRVVVCSPEVVPVSRFGCWISSIASQGRSSRINVWTTQV